VNDALYVIRLAGTKKYSNGGTLPRFKEGRAKVWSRLEDVKRHLAMFKSEFDQPAGYDTWELVEIAPTERARFRVPEIKAKEAA
jgi:hypothetical protein